MNNVVHIHDLALVDLVDWRVIVHQAALREHFRVTSQRVELVWRQDRATRVIGLRKSFYLVCFGSFVVHLGNGGQAAIRLRKLDLQIRIVLKTIVKGHDLLDGLVRSRLGIGTDLRDWLLRWRLAIQFIGCKFGFQIDQFPSQRFLIC